MARNFLLTKVFDAGMPGDRVGQVVMSEYAEAKDFQYFAEALGGSIAVQPPEDELHVQGTRFYGQGPLRMKVRLHYLEGRTQPHFTLVQSFV